MSQSHTAATVQTEAQVPSIGSSGKIWTPPTYSESAKVTINYHKAEKHHCLIRDQMGPAEDSIKILRTRLLQLTRDKGWRTVLITSARPKEGKTVVAINLAFAMAREYQQTIVLVDGDLRNPTIGRYLGIEGQKGLADHFVDNIPLNQIILWPGIEKLTLISGGKPMAHSAEVIGSPQMQALVEEMKARYRDRYVFFDSPPLLTMADTLAFLPLVDCVLLVVESERTQMRDILQARNLIPDDKLLGVVLNKSTMPSSPYPSETR
ncbi:CpsD/CapB family tyrosine-protein kinase [Desulfobulbus elongatus]|uniref:CpsD/CapB family tyrosine-protein kinase n=1 Tax=Desulfobulbus elongatus TaxID=53332 RepID=UPI0009FC3563|nr:CpsD/CapB family tyrosine-protein kinase [Desulfobulbus elongatus]